MNRKKFLRVLLSLTLFLGFGGVSVAPVLAYKQQIASPNVCCSSDILLKNKEGTQVLGGELFVTQTNQEIFLLVKNVEVNNNETLIVVLKDGETKKQISCSYLNKYVISQPFVVYSGTINHKYYNNALDIEIYKQKNTDPAFSIKDENFVGKGRIVAPGNGNFMRDSKKELTVLDGNGNRIEAKHAQLIDSLIPNYYTIAFPEENHNLIGKLILPNGQEHLIGKDEQNVVIDNFRSFVDPSDTSKWTDHGFGFHIYIPKEVKNFKFQIYNGTITNRTEDILYQFDVNLNNR